MLLGNLNTESPKRSIFMLNITHTQTVNTRTIEVNTYRGQRPASKKPHFFEILLSTYLHKHSMGLERPLNVFEAESIIWK